MFTANDNKVLHKPQKNAFQILSISTLYVWSAATLQLKVDVIWLHFYPEKGYWAFYYTNFQSFKNNVFLSVGLITLGILIEFLLVGSIIEYQNVITTNCNLEMG